MEIIIYSRFIILILKIHILKFIFLIQF